MVDVKVPSVGESITSGVLGVWTKKAGEYVKAGEAIFEIETDKVTSEVYAEVSGVLQPLVMQGTVVNVGQVVARIDETVPAPVGTPASAPAPATAAPAAASSTPSAPPLSPAVRFMVEEKKLNPAEIEGTGKGGRILKGDVIAHLEKPAPAPASSTAPATGERVTRKAMSPLRKRIADRLLSAQHEAALLTTFNEVDMSQVMAVRSKFQERFVAKHNIKLGFMSFFVKAVIQALQSVPAINARIDGDEIVQNNFYDLGVAISTEKGLLVPVLRNPDQMSLAQIEQAIAAYAKKARDGKITLPDLEGGVFTITNGGVFGSLLSTPIINPPQSGILGMHTIQERPVAINGRVEIRPMMYIALTYDHRIVDGREAVTFLVRVKEYIENPAVALLDI